MRQKFSTRFSVDRPERLIDNEVPPSLRTRLWNIICHFYLGDSGSHDPKAAKFVSEFFVSFSAVRPPSPPRTPFGVKYLIQCWYFETKWNEVYDFVEFLANYDGLTLDESADVKTRSKGFQESVNRALDDEASAYVFRDSGLERRLTDLEYEMVDAVLALPAAYAAASAHMQKAFDFFVNRNPDYENSVKEAVSALESLLKARTGLSKGKMGELLDAYSKQVQIHPALRNAVSNLFGFASDFAGVRHGGHIGPVMAAETARLVLTVSASICNFVALNENAISSE